MTAPSRSMANSLDDERRAGWMVENGWAVRSGDPARSMSSGKLGLGRSGSACGLASSRRGGSGELASRTPTISRARCRRITRYVHRDNDYLKSCCPSTAASRKRTSIVPIRLTRLGVSIDDSLALGSIRPNPTGRISGVGRAFPQRRPFHSDHKER
jgi:hypothetical protein